MWPLLLLDFQNSWKSYQAFLSSSRKGLWLLTMSGIIRNWIWKIDSAERTVEFWDADFDECSVSHKSHGGFIFFNFWRGHLLEIEKHTWTAASTDESEHVSLAAATPGAVSLRHMFSFVKHCLTVPNLVLHTGSQASMKLAQIDMCRTRTKDVHKDHHMVRHRKPAKNIALKYCRHQKWLLTYVQTSTRDLIKTLPKPIAPESSILAHANYRTLTKPECRTFSVANSLQSYNSVTASLKNKFEGKGTFS